MAAVRLPSEPSMKPLSMPRCSTGSLKSWLARRGSRAPAGRLKVIPLWTGGGEFVFALEGFEDEPVVPGGEVLYGGDAVRERVVDGELEGAAAGVGGGRW